MMESVLLVVFDMDGTLYDTDSSFVPAVRTFLERYDKPMESVEVLHKLIGEPTHVFVEWVKSQKIDADLKEVLAVFSKLERNGIDRHGKLNPYVIETLSTLKHRNVKMAICSNGSHRYVNKIINKFRLDRYVAWVRTPREKKETKGIMLRDLKDAVRPDRAFMVGDRIHDIDAASQAGLIPVGALYGYGQEEMHSSPLRIRAISDLIKILDSHAIQHTTTRRLNWSR